MYTQLPTDETTESDSSLSMFSLSQAHNHSLGAQVSRPVKRTHQGGYSPSDPKNKKRPEMSSQQREQATSGNLTPSLQNIISKGTPSTGDTNRSTLAVGDFLDPALALLEAKKRESECVRPSSRQLSDSTSQSKLNIISLTTSKFSAVKLSVLQLGLGFCLAQPINVSETIKDLYLFTRRLTYKYIFDSDRNQKRLEKDHTEQIKHFTMDEFRALRDLMLLYEESSGESSAPSVETPSGDISRTTTDTCSKFTTDTRFKPKSRHFPDLLTCPNVWVFLQLTIRDLKSQQWSTPDMNLIPEQTEALKSLCSCKDIAIKPSGKGGNTDVFKHFQKQ